jgi:hypothetical protein
MSNEEMVVLKAKDFCFIIVPDTQNMSTSHPEELHIMTQWIADQANEMNLKFVFHVGDLVNDGSQQEIQWENHRNAFDRIEAENIPTVYAIGNHDFDNILKENRDSSAFNRYCGVDRIKDKPWFGGCFEEGKAENLYTRMEIEGIPFLFLILEYGPRDKVVEWANQVLEQHAGHQAIVITHSYMYISGERTKPGDNHNPKGHIGADGANDGEDLWQKCLKHHKNVKAVYSGHHVKGNVSYRFDLGEHGNLVFQSFQNWQMSPNGGDARVRILRYRLQENRVDLQVFNPQTGLYETAEGYETSHPIFPGENEYEQWLAMRFPAM